LFANSFIVLMLFLYHEGFYFLPENWTIVPGVFRMSDAFFAIIPFFALSACRTFTRYREESWLVISFCALMLVSCLMGQLFFPQTISDGFLNLRRNFFWLSFFAYVPLIRDLDRAEKLLKALTILVGCYMVVLLVTRSIPTLGLIHFPKNVYSAFGGLKRFGEFRFFFPYGNIPIMLYCIALARMTHGEIEEGVFTRTFRLIFLAIVFYAAMSSYTRAVVFPLLAVTVYALFTSSRNALRAAAVILPILLVCCQIMITQLGESSSFMQDNKLGKMITKSGTLESEKGRMFQASMYLTQFARSPLTGVGTFAIGKYANREGGELMSYKEFGFFGASDLGYLKILGENGLLGVAWVIWWFNYFFRQGRRAIAGAHETGNPPKAAIVGRGLLFFAAYLLISGVTLGHWVHPNLITILPLALALMAIARKSVTETDEPYVESASLRIATERSLP
jgi:hypothetical protein